MKKILPKPARDNRANQLNPTHPVYYLSRGDDLKNAQLKAAQQHVIENREPTRNYPVGDESL
jgi:hypothetical protein